MRIARMQDETYALSCDLGDLTLLGEGLLAIESADRRLIGSRTLDEEDRLALAGELERIHDMRSQLDAALHQRPNFRVVK